MNFTEMFVYCENAMAKDNNQGKRWNPLQRKIDQ